MRNFGQKHELQYVEKSAMLSRNFKIFMQQNSLVHYFQNINLKQGAQNDVVKKNGPRLASVLLERLLKVFSQGWLIFGEFGCFWKKKPQRISFRKEQEIMQSRWQY